MQMVESETWANCTLLIAMIYGCRLPVELRTKSDRGVLSFMENLVLKRQKRSRAKRQVHLKGNEDGMIETSNRFNFSVHHRRLA